MLHLHVLRKLCCCGQNFQANLTAQRRVRWLKTRCMLSSIVQYQQCQLYPHRTCMCAEQRSAKITRSVTTMEIRILDAAFHQQWDIISMMLSQMSKQFLGPGEEMATKKASFSEMATHRWLLLHSFRHFVCHQGQQTITPFKLLKIL